MAAVVGITILLVMAFFGADPPGSVWTLTAVVPGVGGAVIGLLVRRFTGTELGASGIRSRSVRPRSILPSVRTRWNRAPSVFEERTAPWHRVVDMRAERRGGRTVVSVYLDSGASVQLNAPYSGGFFAADPQFEVKMFALSHIWRSNRFGGLPGC